MGAEVNDRRVIWTLLLPFPLDYYIWARPPGQAQHLAAQTTDLSPVDKPMSRARGHHYDRPHMWYRTGERGLAAATGCGRG